MSGFFTVLLWILAMGALIKLHTALWRRVFNVDRHADQVHYARTGDGWTIAVHRFLSATPKYQEPLLLCPGLAANRFNFDLSDDLSLARYLTQVGFDVWVMELRATGLSSRPGLFNPYSWNFDFDDHLNQDLPAAAGLIGRETGAGKIFLVGHSLGGMLGIARLGQSAPPPGPELAGLVAISAPVLPAGSKMLRHFRLLAWFMAVSRMVVFRPFARFFSPFMGWPPGLLARTTTHKDGMTGPMLRRSLVNLVENCAGGVIGQFINWTRGNGFTSRDGQQDYLENLKQADRPTLIMAAEKDYIAPPDTVIPAYQRLAAEDKQLRLFGTDRGDDYDFGHADLLLGRHAPEAVYPEIAEWLVERATLRNQSVEGSAASPQDM